MEISVEQFNALKEGFVVYDMREEDVRAYGIIPNAVILSADEILSVKKDKDKKHIIYCQSGILSRDIAEKLQKEGYLAFSLTGGYAAWLADSIERKNAEEIALNAERSIQAKFRSGLWSKFTKAVKEYKLISPGDKIAVCISGGKDSMLLAKLMQMLKRYSDVPFDLEYLVMDPGYSAVNRLIIERNAKNLGIPIKIFESDIFESVLHIDKYPCYICARMRRGHLYTYAKSLGCNKIALGHHYDDVIETILMGMLYGAQIQTMMPKLHSTNFSGMELIRPLYLVREEDIIRWRDYNGLGFIRCACKFTDDCASCNNEENRSKRVEIKQLIAELKKKNPMVENHIFKSVENVNLKTLIAYKDENGVHNFLDTY